MGLAAAADAAARADLPPVPQEAEGHDVDLGVVARSGKYATIYQFGEVSGSGNLAGKYTEGTKQLQNVAASRKVVELKVLPGAAKRGRGPDDGSRAFFDSVGFQAGLRTWSAMHPDMELVVTFTAGAEFKLP